MGSLLTKLKALCMEDLRPKEAGKQFPKTTEKTAKMEKGSSIEKGQECKEKGQECKEFNEEDTPWDASEDEMSKARETVSKIEKQICKQKMMIDEHQAKIVLLEQLIQRQLLILKENDDNYTYEQMAQSSLTMNDAPPLLKDDVENLLNSMVEKKIQQDFEAQCQWLQEHDKCIKNCEESLEDQLAKIEMMREILDENSNHVDCNSEVRTILSDHERRLTSLEERMAVYERQVEKRLSDQHQLLVFTWIGLVTTFVLCFAIVCSCCWFK